MSAEAEFTKADLEYVRAEYRTLDQLCRTRRDAPVEVRRLIDENRIQHPTYVLADGTSMFPPDYFILPDHAGSIDALPAYFRDRYLLAAQSLGLPADDAEETWKGYLSGQFGVCLWSVTPEGMAKKTQLIGQIESALSAPGPHDLRWRATLRSSVDALDDLSRPFTDYDRRRWGEVSRDRCITAVRQNHPDVFANR